MTFIAIKRKINEKINEIYSKESSNPYKVKATARSASLILHSDREQIYFMYIIYIYTYTYIHIHIYKNKHANIHTYTDFLSILPKFRF